MNAQCLVFNSLAFHLTVSLGDYSIRYFLKAVEFSIIWNLSNPCLLLQLFFCFLIHVLLLSQ